MVFLAATSPLMDGARPGSADPSGRTLPDNTGETRGNYGAHDRCHLFNRSRGGGPEAYTERRHRGLVLATKIGHRPHRIANDRADQNDVDPGEHAEAGCHRGFYLGVKIASRVQAPQWGVSDLPILLGCC